MWAPLCGAEHEWIPDAKGSHHARLATWLHDDVEAMVRQAAGLIEQELSRTEGVAA